ncbi:zinc finger protein 268-like [Malaya genurostris]|uniref:zinc finger protein 268-like n=1 Tax=Malaya genurostris TaxID=325434 RepID=UPI0026F37E08|nr:zinc finger protein 268-like [Malaya genurostris]
MSQFRKSRRSMSDIKNESLFNMVEIKSEPDGLLNSSHLMHKSVFRKADRIGRIYTKSRAVQVEPDDVDSNDTTSFNVTNLSGDNKPIDPFCDQTVVPQCRICLRRVSRANLKIILAKYKPKTLAALKLKVFPGDAYPFACCNCLNLIDIMLDFKNAVLKAKYLLLEERMFLESEEWDDSESMNAVVKCRSLVEKHKNQIDSIYEKTVKRKRYRAIEDSPHDGDGKGLSYEHSIMSDDQERNVNIETVIVEAVKAEPIAEMTEVEDLKIYSSGDESLHTDCEPTDSHDGGFKLVLKTSKTYRNSKNKEKRSDHVPRGELCDLCGQRVCAQASESHKNRHLGIKPYTCPSEGCELTFYSRENQISHVKRIHGENGVPVHKCDICGRYIRGALKVINYHKRKHDQKKEHVCQFCGKGFTMRQYLKQHVTVVHTEVFPHECRYCGKKFKLKWSMLAHERNVHEKKVSTASAQPFSYELSQNNSDGYA